MSSYIFSRGYRLVVPYLHTSTLRVKQDGISISEIVVSQYGAQELAKVVKAVYEGRVLCNGEPVPSPSHLVCKGDVLSYTQHRHEPEVLATPIDVLHFSDDVLVVNKPSTIPVHPVGTFRMNSVQRIVEQEQAALLKEKPLHTVHRIDRLASGVLIFATCPKRMRQLHKQFSKRSVEKEYVARVKGVFPEGIVEVNRPIASRQTYPITCFVSPDGKPSRTIFERESVSPDGVESIVRCRPVTGRMHQIRVHLKWLGHPIANDYRYGGDLASSCYPNPGSALDGLYTKMDWCSECALNYRDISHVTYEDLNMNLIWLHALRYSSTHSKHQWNFEAPLLSGANSSVQCRKKNCSLCQNYSLQFPLFQLFCSK